MDMRLSKLWEMNDREAWHAGVHGVAKIQARLSDSTNVIINFHTIGFIPVLLL